MSVPNTYRLRTVICTLVAVLGLSALTLSFFTRSFTPTASAAPTTYLNFQGRLKTSSGTVVPDGNYNIEFKIYDAQTAGNLLWTETRTGSNRVRVVNGYFSVSLGSVTAFGTSIPDWGEQLYITMNIGGTDVSPSWDGEMTNAGNRMILTAVPYAFQADRANTANALTDGTNDFTADDFLRIAPGTSQGTSSSDAAVRLNQTGAGGLLQLQSGGSDVLTLSNSGEAVLSGSLTIQTLGSGQGLYVNASQNATTTTYGSQLLLTVNPSSASSSWYYGMQGRVRSSNVSNMANARLVGVIANADYTAVNGSLNSLYAIQTSSTISDGSVVANYRGIAVHTPSFGTSASVQNYAGLLISVPDRSNTNRQAAIFLSESAWDSQPDGDWAIYSNLTDASYLAGSLQVDSDLTVGTSTLFVDVSAGTIGRIGMGTNTPDHHFEIEDTVGGDININVKNLDASGYANFRAENETGADAYFGIGGTNTSGIYSNRAYMYAGTNTNGISLYTAHSNDNILFGTNDTARFAIDGASSTITGFGQTTLESDTNLIMQALNGGMSLLASGNNNITIGTSDTTGTLLVLDTKTDSGDPTGVNGGMYYNSNSNTFRFYQNGSWVNLGTGDIANGGNGGAVTIGTNSPNTLTFETNNQSAMTIASGGAVALQNATNSTAAFSVTNTSGNSPLIVDTTGTYGKVIMSALQFTGSSADSLSFTTPQGSTVQTKILIPLYNPSAGGQLLALGLPSGSATNSRAITLFDNRAAGNNQPVMAVLSPNESNIFGLVTDGSNSNGWLKGVGMNVGLRVGTVDFLQTVSSTGNLQVGTSDTTGQLLVLDTKTDSGDPTGVNGGMYYNSNAGKFRCYEGGAWKDCIPSGSSLFTDGGTATYLTSTSDELVVGGSSSLSAKLSVVGTSDQTQLLVRANATQTNPLILFQNSSGSELARLHADSANLALGWEALSANISGSWNTALGGGALKALESGTNNVAVGASALENNEDGSGNTAVGVQALYSGTTGGSNTAIGNNALRTNNGSWNTAVGAGALLSNLNGSANVALGTGTLYNNASGNWNIAIGDNSMYDSEGGQHNIGIGYRALYNSTGSYNIALGQEAGYNIDSGSNNIVIGAGLDVVDPDGSNQLNIAGILQSEDFTNQWIYLGRQGSTSSVFLGSSYGTITSTVAIANNGTSGATNDIYIGSSASGVGGFTQINSGSGGISLNPGGGTNITIGTSDTTGNLLVLDTKTDSGDPTGVNGGMYYNSDSGKFRCYEGGSWKDCISAGTGDVVNGGQNGTVTLGTNDANTLTLETNNQSAMTIASGGAVTFQNATNSTDALQVRRADGSSMIQVDTENGRIGFNIPGWDNLNYSLQLNSYADSSQNVASVFHSSLSGSADGQTGAFFNTAAPNSNSGEYKIYTGIYNQIGVGATEDTGTLSYVAQSNSANVWSGTGDIHILTGTETGAWASNAGYVSQLIALKADRGTGTNTTVVDAYGLIVGNPFGDGTIANNYGVRIDSQNAGDNNYGLYIEGASGGSGVNYALYVDSGETRFNGQVTIGTSDTSATLLVLDTKTDAEGSLTGVNGAMYYNSNSGKFRCYEGGSWVNCISAGTGDIMNGGQNGTVTLGTNDSNALSFETDGTTRWSVNASGHLLPGADDTYDIGSDTLRVRDIYVGPSSIHIGESGDEVVLSFDTTNDVLNINQSLSIQGDIISNGSSININATGAQDVNIAAGSSTGDINIGNATSGDVSIYSSGTVGLYGNGGSVGIEVGSVFGLSVNTMQFSGTGSKTIRTTAQSTSHSASLEFYSGNVTGGTNRNTGSVTIRTGNGTGTTTNSGSITIDVGTATGTAGIISIGAANTSNLILGRNGININVGGNLVIGTSDTTGTLLVLDTKTDTTDPTGIAGGMYFNSATQSFRCYNGNAWRSCFGGLAYANTNVTGNTVTNTASETNFASSYTIPANSCVPGRVYRVTASGQYSSAASNNDVVIRMYAGSTLLGQTGNIDLNASLNNHGWTASFNIICQTAGASGTVDAQGYVLLSENATPYGGFYSMDNDNTTVTLNTTVSQTLVMSADFIGASTDNSITLRQFIVEDLGY